MASSTSAGVGIAIDKAGGPRGAVSKAGRGGGRFGARTAGVGQNWRRGWSPKMIFWAVEDATEEVYAEREAAVHTQGLIWQGQIGRAHV